jgi:hypothetical protein
MNADIAGGGTNIKAEASLGVSGSDEQVSPSVPSGAKSILELLSDLQSLAGPSLIDDSYSLPYGEDGLYGDDFPIIDDTEL